MQQQQYNISPEQRMKQLELAVYDLAQLLREIRGINMDVANWSKLHGIIARMEEAVKQQQQQQQQAAAATATALTRAALTVNK